ncbi:MerR family transcriptional regulator [Nocardia sp. CDC160]|uniref:MerR family transcriptional regulator n=1 Tax=Nocardia sp. CDC160 TaxID=3112166 RepID=UPI002DB6D611|nr:MerR family transcriptional regulator [Nocardia sp. CDC160]MEC3915156.1 MerR family transcriptional regulator [Nocardia sp. CDC160]
MFSIGDFARFGSVSVRMLRHYDDLGLLRPYEVDPCTGYRFYAADQLARLNRIVALKDLGFTLNQVAEILDGQLSAERLHGMLQLRRAQLANQLAADTARLASVEARLLRIEKEGVMPEQEIIVKPLSATLVAEMSDVAAESGEAAVGPIIEKLYAHMAESIPASGLTITGAPIVYYEPLDAGLRVHVAHQVAGTAAPGSPFELLLLPEIPKAATLAHRGKLAELCVSFEAMGRWADENGYAPNAPIREVYLQAPRDPASDEWVIELQMPVEAQSAR